VDVLQDPSILILMLVMFKVAYWISFNIAIAILDFSLLLPCPPFSYCSSNFAIAKVVALNLFASIFVTVIFSLWPLRATTIAIAIVERAITLEREPSKKKQRTDIKNGAKRIKSDNFTRGNR